MKKILLLTLLLLVTNSLGRMQAEKLVMPFKLLHRQAVPTASVLEWSPDGKFLAVGSDIGVFIFSDTLQFQRLLSQSSDDMCVVDWSPDGKYIATIKKDAENFRNNRLIIWDVNQGTVIASFGSSDGFTGYEIAWSPDSRYIANSNLNFAIEI